MSLSVRALIERARASDPGQFAARLGSLVLLGASPNANEDGAAGWRFLTEKGNSPISENPLGQLLEAVVHPLRKRSSSRAFGDVILVGRAESNDICIAHPSISKLHARVEISSLGFWLKDASSTNGTFYDGQPLAEDERTQLVAGHKVGFGDVELLLFDSSRLHGMLTRFSTTIEKS